MQKIITWNNVKHKSLEDFLEDIRQTEGDIVAVVPTAYEKDWGLFKPVDTAGILITDAIVIHNSNKEQI